MARFVYFPNTDCTNVGGQNGDQTNEWITNRAHRIPPHPSANLFDNLHLGSFATGEFADARNDGNIVSMRLIIVNRNDMFDNIYEGETVPFFYEERKKTGRPGKPILQGVYSLNADRAWSLVAFQSASLAEKLTDVSRSDINRVCNNHPENYTAGTSANGLRFFWEFIELPPPPPAPPSIFDKHFKSKSSDPKASGPPSSSSSLPPAVAGAGGVMMCSIV